MNPQLLGLLSFPDLSSNSVCSHSLMLSIAHFAHQNCITCIPSNFDIANRKLLTASSQVVYFLSSLRGQTAKTLICTKSGVSADSRKSAKKCRKVRRTALFAQKVYKKCAKSAVLRTFRHFSALFLESAETPLFVQINVFAVWPLRLDRGTIPGSSQGQPDQKVYVDVLFSCLSSGNQNHKAPRSYKLAR